MGKTRENVHEEIAFLRTMEEIQMTAQNLTLIPGLVRNPTPPKPNLLSVGKPLNVSFS